MPDFYLVKGKCISKYLGKIVIGKVYKAIFTYLQVGTVTGIQLNFLLNTRLIQLILVFIMIDYIYIYT